MEYVPASVPTSERVQRNLAALPKTFAMTPFTDADEARVQAMIASDPDAPEAADEQLAAARPFAEAFPALAETLRKGCRPRAERPKLAVSIRLDQDVVERFKAAGPGWQSRMNDALRDAVGLLR